MPNIWLIQCLFYTKKIKKSSNKNVQRRNDRLIRETHLLKMEVIHHFNVGIDFRRQNLTSIDSDLYV